MARHAERTPAWARVTVALLLGLATAPGARAAGIAIGQVRYFPKGWTEPEVTANEDGTRSYKPSIPDGFEKRVLGTGVGVGNASTHPNLHRREQPGERSPETARFMLYFRDGRKVQVKPGDAVTFGGEPYTVVGLLRGDFYLRSTRTGAYLKLVRQE